MNKRYWFAIGILSFGTLCMPAVGAREAADRQVIYLAASSSGMQDFSSKLRGRSDFSNVGREWVAELEQSGIVNRSLRGPYRVALPLMSFGHRGPMLMLTYVHRMPGATQGKGVLLFVNIPID